MTSEKNKVEAPLTRDQFEKLKSLEQDLHKEIHRLRGIQGLLPDTKPPRENTLHDVML